MLTQSHFRLLSTLVLLTSCLTANLAVPSLRANELQAETTSQITNTLPARYAGVWKGEGTQTGLSSGWAIAIALKPGNIGDIIGTIAYPSLGCGGELTLRSINADSIEVTEVITYGKECAATGIVALKPIANHTVEYQWSSPQYPGIVAKGTVTKSSAEGKDMPVEYVGVWEGTGTKNNVSGEKTAVSMLMTIASRAAGSIIGTIVYPLTGCGGEVTLQRVNADSIELSEDISYGKNCLKNDPVILKRGDNNTLEYEGRSPLDSSTVTGTLMPIK